MDALLDYAKTHWLGGVLAAGPVLILLYVARRYTVPAFLLTVEFVAYCAIIHVLFHGIVRVAAWFKYESQMKFLVDQKTPVPWRTPLLRFWDLSLYNPHWIFYFEIVLVVGVLILMARYRPMRIQNVRPRPTPLTKGMGQRYDWKDHSGSWKGKK